MELKAKLFRVSVKLRNIMITFVGTNLVGWLSWACLTAFLSFLFGLFVYSDLTSRVTRKLLFGMSFTLSNFSSKTVVALTHVGLFLANGWRWKSTYFVIVLVLQFTELTTGLQGFPAYVFLVGCNKWAFPVVLLCFLKLIYHFWYVLLCLRHILYMFVLSHVVGVLIFCRGLHYWVGVLRLLHNLQSL